MVQVRHQKLVLRCCNGQGVSPEVDVDVNRVARYATRIWCGCV